MEKIMSVTKALADENRVNILMFLSNGEMCLCQIIEMLDLSPSTVSKHIKILLNSGLVSRRKEGRWHYYYLPYQKGSSLVTSSIKWLKKSLADNETVINNKKRLRSVLKRNKEEFCRHYKK
jgi:DNA-binding transcriptional ArsR family regulator